MGPGAHVGDMFLACGAFVGPVRKVFTKEEMGQTCVFDRALSTLGKWVRNGKNGSVTRVKRKTVLRGHRRPWKMGKGR